MATVITADALFPEVRTEGAQLLCLCPPAALEGCLRPLLAFCARWQRVYIYCAEHDSDVVLISSWCGCAADAAPFGYCSTIWILHALAVDLLLSMLMGALVDV